MNKLSGNLNKRYRLDEELMAVLDASKPQQGIVLSGMPCKLLRHLIDADGRVVSVAEFQRSVWKNTLVSDGSVKDYVAQIRAALGDSATDPVFIETVRGRGYRYLGGIAVTSSALPATDLYPTIAVLPPLCCGSNAPDRELAGAGQIIASNIVESLSRSPLINVISSISTRQFNAVSTDVSNAGDALAADYLVTGLYSRTGDRLALSTELSHVRTSKVIYSNRLAADIDVWNDVTNDNLQQLTGDLIAEIIGSEIDAMNSVAFEKMPLYSLMINATVGMHSSSQKAFSQSEQMLESIVNRAQNSTMALALLAQWHLMHMNRLSGLKLTAGSKSRDDAFRYAERALELNPMHPHANAIYGSLEARLNNNTHKAMEHHNIAMAGNPNHSLNHCFKASAYTYQNDEQSKALGIRHANRAIKLSPFDPQLYLYKTVAATANYHAGNLEAALSVAMESHEMNRNHTSNLRTLISILVDLDRGNEVERFKNDLMQLDPGFSISLYKKYGPGIESDFAQRIAANLEAAGVPC